MLSFLQPWCALFWPVYWRNARRQTEGIEMGFDTFGAAIIASMAALLFVMAVGMIIHRAFGED